VNQPSLRQAAPSARLTSENLHDPVLPWVNRRVVSLRVDDSVEDARASARVQANGERFGYLYVVDDGEVLVGYVPVRDLLLARPEARVRDVMREDVMAIPSWATVLVACEYFVNRRLQAFPVIEDSGRLVGAVDASIFTEEMVRLAKQSFDDIFQLAGISLTPGLSAWGAYLNRFPWLLCNIAGGLLAAALTSHYQSLLDEAIVLALFIPVVLALSESVSIQSVTLALQALHGGSFSVRTFLRGLGREAVTALLLGLSCGTILAITSGVWKKQAAMSLAMGAAILVSMTASAIVGLALPTLMHAARANPRIASGPIVLATADTITLVFYFSLAGWMLR
jgi:magnesium transporter